MFYLMKILEAKKVYPKGKTAEKIPEAIGHLQLDINSTNNYGQFDFYRYRICKYRFLLEWDFTIIDEAHRLLRYRDYYEACTLEF